MNKREAVVFLFTIAKEIQHSFVSPVIFLTLKDYAEGIFKSLKHVCQALLDHAEPQKVADIILSFHMQWLEAVKDIEKFKKGIKETPREVIIRAITFTMECTRERYNYLRKYMEQMHSIMTEEENKFMQEDLLIIKEMQDIVNSALLEKQNYIRSQADQTEYHARIRDEIEELMNWLDKLNDSLAIQFCKVLNLKVPVAPSDLIKTLKQIIDEVASATTPEAKRAVELIELKDQMSSAIRISAVYELEIAKVVEKIKTLEDRISRLQNSSALMALKHKTMFLEERLQSLENVKLSMMQLQSESKTGGEATLYDHLNEYKHTHIFNHLLPHHDRCRLVEQLMQLWNSAIVQHDHDSIISILSIANLQEIFSDETGNFIVDKYGRKIDSKADDELLYQLNENNDLAPPRDNERHIYFYDSCGRYYINDTRQRVYKDHDGASEYMLSKCGHLVKVLEEIDGVEFYFDLLGRFYINKKGQHIYCEENSSEEYEHDDFGNLVKIHQEPSFYELSPMGPITMEENKYLKRVLGDALKHCIAQIVVLQPVDPIAYLSESLQKYDENVKFQQKHLQDERDRLEQSQLIHESKEHSPDCHTFPDCESIEDYNLIKWNHEHCFR